MLLGAWRLVLTAGRAGPTVPSPVPPPPPFSGVAALPPTLSGSLRSLPAWQAGCPRTHVLPPGCPRGQQAGPAQDRGGGKGRPSGGPKGAHGPLSALVKRTHRQEHLHKGALKVRRRPRARSGWDPGGATDGGLLPLPFWPPSSAFPAPPALT